jgi:hypothetical protein
LGGGRHFTTPSVFRVSENNCYGKVNGMMVESVVVLVTNWENYEDDSGSFDFVSFCL